MALDVLRMTDLELAGKRVLIREDLNVPVSGGRVTSDAASARRCRRSSRPSLQALP